MPISFQIPHEIEQSLRRELGDLDQAAKEAALVELYRQEKLTHYELSLALELDRFETDAVLKRHNVTEDLPSPEELAHDLQRLKDLLNK
jgi:hypothetical protein